MIEEEAERKVSIPLGIGIFLLPIFFVWFLLRQGHSTLARVLGFGWFGLTVLISISSPPPTHSSAQAVASSTSSEQAIADANNQTISLWRYSESRDEMRNSTIRFARLTSENELDFEFPYGSNNSTQLVIQQRPQDGLSIYLEIEKGQFLCHSFGNSSVAVKFDDGPVSNFRCTDSSDGTSNIAFIEPTSRFLGQLRRANRLVIEAEFFHEGNRQIMFNTSGLQWR
ncbi:MAG: hypothetical protein ABL882_11630 [Sphingopyxis sp.]